MSENDGLIITETNFEPEESHIETILRQTAYTREEAIQKLKEKNNNTLSVIREYLGIQERPPPPMKSVNQEIYRQIRGKMDVAMRDYTQRKEEKENREKR
jgi:hypothetical protein